VTVKGFAQGGAQFHRPIVIEQAKEGAVSRAVDSPRSKAA